MTFPFPVPPEASGQARELARALEARGFTVTGYARQLERVLLGIEPFPGEWRRSGIAPDLLESSAQWRRASFQPRELFVADAVRAGAAFDALVTGGALTSGDLAAFLQQTFLAVVNRAPLPALGDPLVANALQWVCDLFVDAHNADPGMLRGLDAYLGALARGEATAGQLCGFLAGRAPIPAR